MTQTALRPRYKFKTSLPPEEIRGKLKTALKDPERNPLGLQHRSVSNHLIIAFPRKHRHFWSPTLDINLETVDDGKTTVRVLIGPEPSIWTMFMFFYAVSGLLFTAGLVLGYSQYALGHDSWLLLLMPAGLGLAAFFYFAALAGKGRAREQTGIMKGFVEGAIGEEIMEEPKREGSLA